MFVLFEDWYNFFVHQRYCTNITGMFSWIYAKENSCFPKFNFCWCCILICVCVCIDAALVTKHLKSLQKKAIIDTVVSVFYFTVRDVSSLSMW